MLPIGLEVCVRLRGQAAGLRGEHDVGERGVRRNLHLIQQGPRDAPPAFRRASSRHVCAIAGRHQRGRGNGRGERPVGRPRARPRRVRRADVPVVDGVPDEGARRPIRGAGRSAVHDRATTERQRCGNLELVTSGARHIAAVEGRRHTGHERPACRR